MNGLFFFFWSHVGGNGFRKKTKQLSLLHTVDRLAKVSSQAPQIQNPVTYREAKTLLHFRYNGDWKKGNGGYQAHLDPIWRLERAQQTVIYTLTQFGDWSRPSRPLSFACAQGIAV